MNVRNTEIKNKKCIGDLKPGDLFTLDADSEVSLYMVGLFDHLIRVVICLNNGSLFTNLTNDLKVIPVELCGYSNDGEVIFREKMEEDYVNKKN
jgi:hypothetical protein